MVGITRSKVICFLFFVYLIWRSWCNASTMSLGRSVRDMKSARIPELLPQSCEGVRQVPISSGVTIQKKRSYAMNLCQFYVCMIIYIYIHLKWIWYSLFDIVYAQAALKRRWLEYHANSGGRSMRGGRGGGYVSRYNQSRQAEMDNGSFNPGMENHGSLILRCFYKLVPPPSCKWIIIPLTIDISPINHTCWTYQQT